MSPWHAPFSLSRRLFVTRIDGFINNNTATMYASTRGRVVQAPPSIVVVDHWCTNTNGWSTFLLLVVQVDKVVLLEQRIFFVSPSRLVMMIMSMKLQMERIRQQIEAKKQRKLLRKLQKKQQILQATTTGNEGSNDASSSSATTEKHLALDHCLVGGADTAASETAAAVDPAPFDDMFSTESNLNHVAAFEDKNHGVVSNNHKNASFSSPTSSDLWMNCEPIEYNPYRATTTSHAPARMPQALNYYDHQGYAMQYYNFSARTATATNNVLSICDNAQSSSPLDDDHAPSPFLSPRAAAILLSTIFRNRCACRVATVANTNDSSGSVL